MTANEAVDQALVRNAREGERPDHGEHNELSSAFRRSVHDGQARLDRTWPGLLATGLVGGVDLTLGVTALYIVEDATGSHLLGSLAFTIGFIALTLAKSELFTENFLVPVMAVVAAKAGAAKLARLWGGTLVMNLLAAWGLSMLVVAALPELRPTAVRLGRHYPELGITWEAFAAGILGGAVITLMTWMQRNTEGDFGRIAAAVAASFLLAAGPLNHVIVSSAEMFTALHAGAPFGYADWLGATVWAAAANIIGGLGLVTMLRLVQVGADDILGERRRPAAVTASEKGEEA